MVSSPWGHKELDTTERVRARAHTHTHTHTHTAGMQWFTRKTPLESIHNEKAVLILWPKCFGGGNMRCHRAPDRR